MSTHLVHPPGVAALERWGLVDRLVTTGCPPIDTYSFDFGPLQIAGSPGAIDGVGVAYSPRRTVLDKLLVDAALRAGAELREAFTVDELLFSEGAVTGIRGHARGLPEIRESARLVIGADGIHSIVAKSVAPDAYNERPARCAMYYAYWSGLELDAFATTMRTAQRRGWAAAPTHDGLTVLGVGWPVEEFHANRRDIEGSYLAAIDLDQRFAEQVHRASRESRFVGTAELPGYFRKPYGPGWALVGDAGYHKNPITAMGISDAFRDAELLASAVDESLERGRSYEDAMVEYQRGRDRDVAAMYDLTDEFARIQPPPSDMQQLLGAIHGNQDATDAFIGVQAGTVPPPEFFAPENIARMMDGGNGAGTNGDESILDARAAEVIGV
jgi:2-polyprenyl-6-methoxyphenol hydroxylase-like FAD-dependent oxidoreductase